MTENATGRPRRTPFIGALRYHLWELPRREREAERRRQEEQKRADERFPNRLLEASLSVVLLALLARGDGYGYGILRDLEEAGLPLAYAGRLYPALRGLERDALAESYVVPQDEGKPPRKYYRIVPAGRAALEESWHEWRSTARAIDALRPPGGER